MNMDLGMAFAVAGKLPPLDDGAAAATQALIGALAGRKR
jgi:hypothetical protein